MIKHLPDIIEYEGFESSAQRHLCIEAYYRADKKGVIRMTQGELAEVCLMSPRAVAGHIPRLCELGLLAWVRRGRYAIPTRSRVENGETGKPDTRPTFAPEVLREACTKLREFADGDTIWLRVGSRFLEVAEGAGLVTPTGESKKQLDEAIEDWVDAIECIVHWEKMPSS
jgi:hypothetical protein